ncbi:hypothetical protein FACS189499_08610 [Clostridia bacterium]|nr:hypothetical protein FACS189499_08610 [Clostridia bacterium]
MKSYYEISERHDKLIRILKSKECRLTYQYLANVLHSNTSTIKRNVITLTLKFPLITYKGHGGVIEFDFVIYNVKQLKYAFYNIAKVSNNKSNSIFGIKE